MDCQGISNEPFSIVGKAKLNGKCGQIIYAERLLKIICAKICVICLIEQSAITQVLAKQLYTSLSEGNCKFQTAIYFPAIYKEFKKFSGLQITILASGRRNILSLKPETGLRKIKKLIALNIKVYALNIKVYALKTCRNISYIVSML